MFKNLALLLKLKAWLASGTLKTGGVVAVVGGLQTFFSSQDGLDLLNQAAGWVGLTGSTLSGIVIGLIGLVMLVLRAKTERSLADKVADPPK